MTNANKQFKGVAIAVLLTMLGGSALALDAHGQSKVNNAMAKKWSSSDSNQDGYKVQQGKSVVNIGNKKDGNCVVNIGTVQKGQKAPKDIVVTTKEVINVCK